MTSLHLPFHVVAKNKRKSSYKIVFQLCCGASTELTRSVRKIHQYWEDPLKFVLKRHVSPHSSVLWQQVDYVFILCNYLLWIVFSNELYGVLGECTDVRVMCNRYWWQGALTVSISILFWSNVISFLSSDCTPVHWLSWHFSSSLIPCNVYIFVTCHAYSMLLHFYSQCWLNIQVPWCTVHEAGEWSWAFVSVQLYFVGIIFAAVETNSTI